MQANHVLQTHTIPWSSATPSTTLTSTPPYPWFDTFQTMCDTHCVSARSGGTHRKVCVDFLQLVVTPYCVTAKRTPSTYVSGSRCPARSSERYGLLDSCCICEQGSGSVSGTLVKTRVFALSTFSSPEDWLSAGLCKLVQACASLCRLVQACASLCKLVQACASL